MSDFEGELTAELQDNTSERHRLQARANALQEGLRRLRCGEPEALVRARIEASERMTALRMECR